MDINDCEEEAAFPEIRYPKAGDQLITESHVGDDMLWGEWLDWSQYADAYKEGADRLVETLTGMAYEDRLLCPIIFMYRHYVELKLKELVLALDGLGGTQIPEKDFIKHNLLLFWNYVKTHMNCIKGKADCSILDSLGSLIKQLSDLDPDSMHFRYSVDKQFAKMAVPSRLDVKHLKYMMKVISNGFGYIEGGIDAEKEGRAIEAEFYSDVC